jgi:hypothetical protein
MNQGWVIKFKIFIGNNGIETAIDALGMTEGEMNIDAAHSFMYKYKKSSFFRSFIWYRVGDSNP